MIARVYLILCVQLIVHLGTTVYTALVDFTWLKIEQQTIASIQSKLPPWRTRLTLYNAPDV